MNTHEEKRRMYYSMVTSFAIHLCILIFISILGITYTVVFSNKKEETLEYKVNYLPKQVIMYKNTGLEEFPSLPSPLPTNSLKNPIDKQLVENKEVDKEEKDFLSIAREMPEMPKIDFRTKKNIEDRHEVTTNVQSSPIRTVRSSKSFENIDINSKEFKKCASKLFWNIKKLETLEDIKNYYDEIHFVKNCPSEKDCLMIDSYVNKTYHICNNPADSDFKGYPLSAKVTALNNFPELLSFSQEMLSNAGCNGDSYSEIFILSPKSHWIEMFSCFDEFLSKYDLSLQDDKVKRICIRYVKKGNAYTTEVESATIEKDGKIIQIDN